MKTTPPMAISRCNCHYDVPANEFMNIEGQQFSTSRNWAVWLPDLLERYQADAVRFLCRAHHARTPG